MRSELLLALAAMAFVPEPVDPVGGSREPTELKVRAAPTVRARAGRSKQRRSLAYFGHLTDPQLADEASPARVEFLDSAGGRYGTFWRRHEPFGLHVLDQAVRAMNAERVSRTATHAGRARMAFTLVTGDLADNAQLNEMRWAVRVLEGKRVDPFSGRRIRRGNPCPGASRAAIRRLNRGVANRRYSGVSRFRSYWDPNRARPRYPGILERAQQPFMPQGLQMPWYSARGNHDALPQGMFGPRRAHPRSLATGCRKVFPGRRVRRGWFGEVWSALRRRLPGARFVAPDRSRRFIRSPHEFRAVHGRRDRRHGFGLTSPAPRRASRGAATYYAFSPRPGVRFVSLDTTSDTSGPNGNLDHPQYLWLARQLRLARAGRQRVVVYGHHSLPTMNNPAPDEEAGRFDRDPRNSLPLHFGRTGSASVGALLRRHPNVVLYLAGHVHRHDVVPRFDRRGSGFWEVNTAALADAPQKGRTLELMSNGDGTMSIISTSVDHAAPGAAPRRGGLAEGMTNAQLASVSRYLATGRKVSSMHPHRGTRLRQLELVLRDPVLR